VNELLMKRRKEENNIESGSCSRAIISLAGALILARRCSALRQHEFTIGFNTERENLSEGCQEKRSSRETMRLKVSKPWEGADWSVVARNWVKTQGVKGPNLPAIDCSQPQGRSCR